MKLAEITGADATNTDVLSGHTLSAWTLREIAEAELAIDEAHVEAVARGAKDATPEVLETMSKVMAESLGFQINSYGGPGFWAATRSAKHLGRFLYLSLRQTDPKMTAAAAETLVKPENFFAVSNAVRICAGFKPAPRPNVGGGEPNENAPKA